MSRPEALTPDKRREIIALAHCGLSRRMIAGYVGCAPATIENTARRSPEFAEALRYASSRFIMENVRSIQQQARHSWRAAAWCLERTQPHVFGRRDAGALQPAEQESQLRRLGDALIAAAPEEHREALAEAARRAIDELRSEFPQPHGWDDDAPLAGELVRRVPASDVPSDSVSHRPPGHADDDAPESTAAPATASPSEPDDRDLKYPPSAAWPPPLPPSPGLSGLGYDLRRNSEEFDRSRTAREYREMPDNRLKYDLLHRDVERILRSSSEAAAINFYRAATRETPTNARYAVEAIQADCQDNPFPPPPPKPAPLPKPTSSPATPLPPSPEPGNVRTVPADPATGTPHTTTILLSLLCAILLGGLFFSRLVSPPKADGHAVSSALSQTAASTSIAALPPSSPATNAVVPASSAARPKMNPAVINHIPSTPPTHCSTTLNCPTYGDHSPVATSRPNCRRCASV